MRLTATAVFLLVQAALYVGLFTGAWVVLDGLAEVWRP